jgi:hypothetical protein
MKYPTARRISAYTLVISLLLALIFACSTLPTAQTAKDLGSIRGKWEGWGTNQKYGRFFVTLTIRESGEWQMKMDTSIIFKGSQFSGKAWVTDGKVEVFTENPQLRGTYTLHAKQDKRWLVFISDDGATTAELVPSFR